MSRLVDKKYILPFGLITLLFFVWGFARAILDVLNKHFQENLHLSISQSALIQVTTYMGYFLMAIPAGILISRCGYRRGVVTGLTLFGAGSLLFIPGEAIGSFAVFLGALFVIGCGLVMLETAANPYAAELGAPETAASRLNLAQSFNGLGCIVAPMAVGGFLFSDTGGSVAVPYTIMGVAVLAIALMFSRVTLPELAVPSSGTGAESFGQSVAALRRSRRFCFGLAALFCYEVAEISINSLFINYVTSDGWMDNATASLALSLGALTLFMVARVAGSWVMSRVAAERVLALCAVFTVAGALLVAADLGAVSRCGLFGCYAFEAIMFPTIFAITIAGVGPRVKTASSILMMTPIGGAVGTLLMSRVADTLTLSASFIVPAVGYAAVAAYAFYALKLKKK